MQGRKALRDGSCYEIWNEVQPNARTVDARRAVPRHSLAIEVDHVIGVAGRRNARGYASISRRYTNSPGARCFGLVRVMLSQV